MMAKDKPNYRELTDELTQLLADMQDDGLDVDEALKKYERGQQLVRQLSDYLKQAENSITIHKMA